MAYPKYKEEKKAHSDLIDLLKKHFFEDEMEIKDEEEEEMEEMKPMSKNMGMKRGKSYGSDSDMEYEGEEDIYDSEGEDDDYYDKMMEESEEEDEEEPKLSKDKRKKMAVVLVTKKAGRGKI